MCFPSNGAQCFSGIAVDQLLSLRRSSFLSVSPCCTAELVNKARNVVLLLAMLFSYRCSLFQLVVRLIFTSLAIAADSLSSSDFTNCLQNATIRVNYAYVGFEQATGTITFDVSGTSTEVQKVKASLVVLAYGTQVYQRTFDPCDESTKVAQLCPGEFSYRVHARVLIPCSSQRNFYGFWQPDRAAAIPRSNPFHCIHDSRSRGKRHSDAHLSQQWCASGLYSIRHFERQDPQHATGHQRGDGNRCICIGLEWIVGSCECWVCRLGGVSHRLRYCAGLVPDDRGDGHAERRLSPDLSQL